MLYVEEGILQSLLVVWCTLHCACARGEAGFAKHCTKSNIAKLSQTLYQDQCVCLTQLSALVDTLLGSTTDVEYDQQPRCYLS
jgi:hypothetical protein